MAWKVLRQRGLGGEGIREVPSGCGATLSIAAGSREVSSLQEKSSPSRGGGLEGRGVMSP